VMRELMGVPVKVAAATSTFTVGITASAALIVFAGQGRIDYQAGAAVVVGGVVGGALGANVHDRLQPQQVRRTLIVLLFAIGIVLLVRA
jgi:uncharacterized protein